MPRLILRAPSASWVEDSRTTWRLTAGRLAAYVVRDDDGRPCAWTRASRRGIASHPAGAASPWSRARPPPKTTSVSSRPGSCARSGSARVLPFDRRSRDALGYPFGRAGPGITGASRTPLKRARAGTMGYPSGTGGVLVSFRCCVRTVQRLSWVHGNEPHRIRRRPGHLERDRQAGSPLLSVRNVDASRFALSHAPRTRAQQPRGVPRRAVPVALCLP